MPLMLNLVWLAAVVATTAFGNSPKALTITPCTDNTGGVCGGCSQREKFPLTAEGKCEASELESELGFLKFAYHSASCDADGNTFTFTRWKDDPERPDSCGDALTLTAPLGCVTRHIVGRLTVGVKTATSVSLSGVGGSATFTPLLKLCESEDENCPADCDTITLKLEANGDVDSCPTVTSTDGYVYSYGLSVSLSGTNVELSLKLWENGLCNGNPIVSVEPKTLSLSTISNDGICIAMGTQHWDVTCGEDEPPTDPTALSTRDNTPSFVDSKIIHKECGSSTDGACGDCTDQAGIDLKKCQPSGAKVAFKEFNRFSASCNETDNTFTYTHHEKLDCSDVGVTMTSPVGCVTRYIMAKATVQVVTGRFGVPTGIKPVIQFCESIDMTCPADCSVTTKEIKQGDFGECTHLAGSYFAKVTVDYSHPNVEFGLSVWKNKIGARCSGEPIKVVDPKQVTLATIDEASICFPITHSNFEVTCVPNDSSASGALVWIGLATTLIAALLL